MTKKVKNEKRWKKGDSCLSNATCKKYRSQINFANACHTVKSEGITKEALLRLDAMTAGTGSDNTSAFDTINNQIELPAESVHSFSTIKSFASDWSQCSNTSFTKFLNEFDGSSELDEQTLAVLTEVSKIIKEENGDESSMEYYAILMNMLKNLNTAKETTRSAIFYLLGMLVKQIPSNVLKIHFNVATKPAIEFLEQCQTVKIQYSILKILGHFLRALEPFAWTEKSVQHIFNHVLVFVVSSEPKLRKIATKKIVDIFADKSSPKAVQQVSEFCLRELAKSNHEISVLFMMNFLKIALLHFETSQIQKICVAILLKIKSNNATYISSGLKTLSYLFMAENNSNLTANLNEQLILKLHDCQPNDSDETLVDLWMNVQVKGCLCLVQKDVKKCTKTLPKLVSVLMTTLLCDNRQRLIDGSTESLVSLFENCVSRIVEQDGEFSKEETSVLEVIFSIIEKAFSFQANKVWPNLFRVVQVIFCVCGRKCARMLESYIVKLVSLRQSPHCEHVSELENCIGAAIRYVGVETVLRVVPIHDSRKVLNDEFEWMLPVLKINVRNSSVAYFMENLHVMAENVKQLAIQTDGPLAKKLSLTFSQIWSLLPSFCRNPDDFDQSNFRNVLEYLGHKLKEDSETRSIVMEALRNLIRSDAANDKQVMSNYAKNYVPILLNLYLSVSSTTTTMTTMTTAVTPKATAARKLAEKSSICDTIKYFFEIANDEFRVQYFNEIVERLKRMCETDSIGETTEDLVDLTIALVPFQKVDNVVTVCEYCSRFFLSSTHRKMQKKSYRLLRSVLEHFQTEPLLVSMSETIHNIMLKSRRYVCVTSRNYRIGCLVNLLRVKQPSSRSKFLRAAVDESVTGLNDTNTKFRANCSQLICEIADVVSKKNAIAQFIELLVDDMTEIVQVPQRPQQRQKLVCTLSAIAIVMKKHPEFFEIENEHTSSIFDGIFEQLKNANRPVLKAALQCTRVFCKKYATPYIYNRLPIIVSNLAKIDNRNLSKFRIPVKYLLNLLLKNFGRNTLVEHIPENSVLLKLITNNLKMERRKARTLSQRSSSTVMSEELDSNDDTMCSSDDESFGDETVSCTSKKSRKEKRADRKGSGAVLCENNDEIVNLMDLSIKDFSQPQSSKTADDRTAGMNVAGKSNDGEFKMSRDGRLIITYEAEKKRKPEKVSFKLNDDGDHDDGDDSDDSDSLLSDEPDRKTTSMYDSRSMKSGTASQQSSVKSIKRGIYRNEPGTSRCLAAARKQSDRKSSGNGDVKKANQVDPYVYIPMNRQFLNKRKRSMASRQLLGSIKKSKNKNKSKASKKNKTK